MILLKIAFDAKRAFHNFTGLGNYSRTLLEGLSKYYPQHDYILYTPKIKDRRGVEWEKSIDDFVIKTPDSLWGRIFPAAWRSLFLSREVVKTSPDIYHGLSHELPPGIQNLKCKKVVTIHDLIFLRYPEYFSNIDCRIFERKFRHSCRVADVVVAICKQTRNDLINMLGVPKEKIKVVYQSCNPIYYEKAEEDRLEAIRKKYFLPYNYILYVGSLIERKNALNIVRALALTQKVNDLPLVIVGSGRSYKKKIIELARKLKVLRKIIFLSNVPTEDLPLIYGGAMVFAYPSFFEGWGIPIIEAQMSKVPVVTSTGSCFSESGGEAAFYVDPNDHEQLAQTILELCEKPDLRADAIEKGLRHAKKFHQKNTTNALMKLYQDL